MWSNLYTFTTGLPWLRFLGFMLYVSIFLSSANYTRLWNYMVYRFETSRVFWRVSVIKLRDIACFQTKSHHFRWDFFYEIYHRRVFTYCTWGEKKNHVTLPIPTPGVTARKSCGFEQNYGFWFLLNSNKLHNLQGFVIRPGHENLVSMSAVDTIADDGIRY